MFPIIKRTSNNFIFDSRLNNDELDLLNDCIGRKINFLKLEQAVVSLNPTFKLSCFGRCCFQFELLNSSQINICFQSLFGEVNGPVLDQGGVLIQKITTKFNDLKRKLLFPPHEIDKSFVVNIKYPFHTPIKCIKFYGNQESKRLDKIDEDISLKDIQEYGFKEFPTINCNSIEFFMIEHESNQKSIISMHTGGFWFNLEPNKKLTQALIQESYVKVNGYNKNIVLHHEIK